MIVLTFLGRRIDISAPAPEDIAAEDIAHALAAQPCYGGRSCAFYSRAERAIRLHHEVLRPHLRLHALLQKAEMAYEPDDGFDSPNAAARMRACILSAFGVTDNDTASLTAIHAAKSRLAAIEARDLFGITDGALTMLPVGALMHAGQAEMRYLRLLNNALIQQRDAQATPRPINRLLGV